MLLSSRTTPRKKPEATDNRVPGSIPLRRDMLRFSGCHLHRHRRKFQLERDCKTLFISLYLYPKKDLLNKKNLQKNLFQKIKPIP